MSERSQSTGKSLAESSSSSPSSSLRDILQVPGNFSKSLIARVAQRASPGAKKKVAKKTSVNLFQAITAMKKGLQVWKLPHKHYLVGKPHICLLRLSRDEQYLYWYSHKTKAEVVVYREQIVAVESDLPQDLKSWKGYADSLAFTVYYHQVPKAAKQQQQQDFLRLPSSRDSFEGVANVTFVCKNDTDHKIWTVTLQILLEVSDLRSSSTHNASSSPKQQLLHQRAGVSSSSTSARDDAGKTSLASLLSTQVMTSEIGQIARNVGAVVLVDEKLSAAEALTPSGSFKSPAAVVRSESRKSLGQEAGAADGSDLAGGRESGASLLTTSSQQYDKVTESLISYQLGGDRVIADSWVWGRGMAKVGKYVADQLYPALLHGQKTLDPFQIACGEHHVVIIDEFGSVYSWGFSDEGQLGHGAPIETFGPMQVKAFEGSVISQVSCGTTTTIAVTEKGEAFLWGHPMYSFAEPTWYPKRMDTGKHKIMQVSCGAYHFAMCTSDGKVLTCGGGKFGALGHGSLDNCSKPKLVESLSSSFTEHVSCGIWHTAAVVKKYKGTGSFGEVYSWGDNSVGQLGCDEPKQTSWPLHVEGMGGEDVASVACGRHHTCARSSAGSLFSWGSNKHGQLGRVPAEGKESYRPGLVEIEGGIVTEIAAGMDHNLAVVQIDSQSFLYSWGNGAFGCLGHGDSSSVRLPQQIKSLARKTVCRIACGANTSCAIIEHHFHSQMERTDRCKHCMSKIAKRSQKKKCSRCNAAFCKSCCKQFDLIKPLQPLRSSGGNVKQSKLPLVCMECNGVLLEAQFEAKFHSPAQPKKVQGKQQKTVTISVDPRFVELEQQLRAANAEIKRLKERIGEIT